MRPKLKNRRPNKKNYHTYHGVNGMTMNAITDLWRSQGGRCANIGCRALIPVYGRGRAVHHDPVSGAPKGMLCWNCMLGLAQFHSNPRRIVGVLAFLGFINANLLKGK